MLASRDKVDLSALGRMFCRQAKGMVQMGLPTTAVVISGAVARGAYEAAAMTELLPRVLPDLSEVIFLGTSAGAINAVLWAGLARPGTSVAEVGRQVKQVWATLDDTQVFASPVPSLARSLLGAVKSELFGRGGPTNLLDATPLHRTVEARFRELHVADNLRAGSVAGVGVAATFSGDKVAGARSHFFYQTNGPAPRPSPGSAIDYYPTELQAGHVLASSAVPILFQSIPIAGNWYVDGGVRLNTPIAPALAFGVKRVIVISSHTAYYPAAEPLRTAPVISHSIATMLHTVLADGMIEDLRDLRRKNQMVAQVAPDSLQKTDGRGAYQLIEHLVVSPPPGILAHLARLSLRDAPADGSPEGLRRKLRYRALERLFLRELGAGAGVDEILSYFLFDPAYFAAQFKRGVLDAQAAGDRFQI
ncbi:MAG: hypothetical protein JWN48_1570 [Myxococcaceae bacterium]|nr:hypothetical protein [Myxococcaceae bacterium]